MVKHVILWKLKDDIANKQEVLENIKQHLEALVGEVPGLTSCKVNICPLASSNADLMLDTTLTSEEALKGYQLQPIPMCVRIPRSACVWIMRKNKQ